MEPVASHRLVSTVYQVILYRGEESEIKDLAGRVFKLYCSKQHGAGTIEIINGLSYDECVDTCGARAGCFAIDYAKSNGYCYLLRPGVSPPREPPFSAIFAKLILFQFSSRRPKY